MADIAEWLAQELESADAIVHLDKTCPPELEGVSVSTRPWSDAEATTPLALSTVLVTRLPARLDPAGLTDLGSRLDLLRPGGRNLLVGADLSAVPAAQLAEAVVSSGCIVVSAGGLGPRNAGALMVLRIDPVDPRTGDDGDGDGAVRRLSSLLAIREGQLHQSLTRAQEAETQLRQVRESVSFRGAQTLAAAARHPIPNAARLPGQLLRLLRSRPARSRGPEHSSPAKAAGGRRATGTPSPRRLLQVTLPAQPTGHSPSSNGQSPTASDRSLTFDTPPTSFVMRRLAGTGLAGYEPETLATFLALIDRAGPGPVWDVGANIGIYALLAAQAHGRPVHAFEPTPGLADSISRSAWRSGVNVHTHAWALGSSNTRAELHFSDVTDSSNSLLAGFRPSRLSVTVPVRTIDSVAEMFGPPAVLKVDTEGAEPEVIAGGMQTLRDARPWVLCEVLRGRVEDRLMELFSAVGYTWWHIGDQVPFDQPAVIEGDPEYSRLMWMFCPQPPDDALWRSVTAWREALDALAPVGSDR